MVRIGFSEKVTLEKHPEQFKETMAEGTQRCVYERQRTGWLPIINADQQSSALNSDLSLVVWCCGYLMGYLQIINITIIILYIIVIFVL